MVVTDEAGNTDTDELVVVVLDITPPIAVAGKNRSIREGGTVDLNGSASWDNVDIVRWTWTFEHQGDKVVLDGEAHEFQFEETGDYRVELEVRDAQGNSNIDVIVIHVEAIREPVFVATVIIAIVIIVSLVVFGYLRMKEKGVEE